MPLLLWPRRVAHYKERKSVIAEYYGEGSGNLSDHHGMTTTLINSQYLHLAA